MPLDSAYDTDLDEELRVAIGDAFTCDELDRIVLLSTGNGLFKEYVPPGLTDRDTVFKLLLAMRTREAARLPLFFAHVADQRGDLHPLIKKACPEAFERLITIKQQVPRVVEGLETLRKQMKSPDVRGAIEEARDIVTQLITDIERLRRSKILHDCLHHLQLTPFAVHKTAVLRMSLDQNSKLTLRELEDRLRRACADARDCLSALPETQAERRFESKWIEQLESAMRKLKAGLDSADQRLAIAALMRIRVVLRNQPPRLNDEIQRIAGELPLTKLAETTKRISRLQHFATSNLSTIAPTIQDLQATVLARVEEHGSWQLVDEMIWQIEEIFGWAASECVDALPGAWVDTSNSVEQLTRREPKTAWSLDITQYSEAFADELARESSEETALDCLRSRFDDYRRCTRFRFFEVDRNLRRDCGELVQISEPLQAVLEELDDV